MPTKKQPEKKGGSSGINRTVQELMQTVDALRILYMEETEALQKADVRKFSALQDHKIAVARAYQAQTAELMAQKDQLKLQVHPELRRQLRQKEHEFSLVCRLNLEWLDRMGNCTQRLGNRILEAAREHARKSTASSYGARGKLEQNERRVSLSLNESA